MGRIAHESVMISGRTSAPKTTTTSYSRKHITIAVHEKPCRTCTTRSSRLKPLLTGKPLPLATSRGCFRFMTGCSCGFKLPALVAFSPRMGVST